MYRRYSGLTLPKPRLYNQWLLEYYIDWYIERLFRRRTAAMGMSKMKKSVKNKHVHMSFVLIF
jgi:hypothetical protein